MKPNLFCVLSTADVSKLLSSDLITGVFLKPLHRILETFVGKDRKFESFYHVEKICLIHAHSDFVNIVSSRHFFEIVIFFLRADFLTIVTQTLSKIRNKFWV